MGDSKHTPAPWSAVKGAQGYIDPDIGGDGMLSIEGGTAGSADWGKNEQLTLAVVLADVEPIASEAEANARLIAAAPDLLEALRKANTALHCVCEELDEHLTPGTELDTDIAVARYAAEEAIAKAEEATNG